MHIERRPVSLPQLIGYAVIIAVNSFVAGGIWISTQNRIDKLDDRLALTNEAVAEVDTAVAQVQTRIEPLPNLTFRMGLGDARDDAQDKRIDSLLATVSAKLDALSQNVNTVRSDVRVLTDRVERSINGDGNARIKPTSLARPSEM